jgi:hypothetical protein
MFILMLMSMRLFTLAEPHSRRSLTQGLDLFHAFAHFA